jgi:hypothetical protein
MQPEIPPHGPHLVADGVSSVAASDAKPVDANAAPASSGPRLTLANALVFACRHLRHPYVNPQGFLDEALAAGDQYAAQLIEQVLRPQPVPGGMEAR